MQLKRHGSRNGSKDNLSKCTCIITSDAKYYNLILRFPLSKLGLG